MQILITILGVTLALALIALRAWRLLDARREDAVWRRLATGPAKVSTFDPAMVADLPDPARRYFTFAIAPGARLRRVALIEMRGAIGLGDKDAPNYRPMRARQILAPPYGLVWKLDAGRGLARLTGSDGAEGGASWTRFWLFGLLPVVRAGGNLDHARAAFGRVVAEAAFWAPAALLPSEGVTWEALDADTARATVAFGGMTQTVDMRVAQDGRPAAVVMPRWSDANPDKVFRLQPFGGTLDDFRAVEGYRLPFRVEGGNHFGTDAYFSFYKAEVEAIRFAALEGDAR